MSKRILYKNEENGVSVVVPSEDCGLTVEQIAEKDVPKGTKYFIVDVDKIPTDRTFRNAWELDGETIKVNFNKAKEDWIDRAKNIMKGKLADFLMEGKDIKTEAESLIAQIHNAKDLKALENVINTLK